MHHNVKDLVGQRFGKLVVVGISPDRGNRGQIKWDCVCDCGNKHTVTGESIRSGKSKSCGCLKFGRPLNFNEDRKWQLISLLYKSSRITKKGTDLTLQEFRDIILSKCHYCGIDNSNIARDIRGGKIISDTILNYNGIDRADSNVGYIKTNVVPCCKYCNMAKATMTDKEFRNWIVRVYNYMNNSSSL